MLVSVPLNKKNIEILQNIKRDNDVAFKVIMDEKRIEITFKKLLVKESHFNEVDKSFIDLLYSKVENDNEYSKIIKKNDYYIFKEVTEKIISLKLSIDNTIAVEKLVEKYPGKTQTEIINSLIEKGVKC